MSILFKLRFKLPSIMHVYKSLTDLLPFLVRNLRENILGNIYYVLFIENKIVLSLILTLNTYILFNILFTCLNFH